jgi:hypothetical protein
MDIDPRPHPTRATHEYRAAIRGGGGNEFPILAWYLLHVPATRPINGHIRATYLASRISVSSWRPKLPSSSLDANWSPLEAWYLDCIRVASHAGVPFSSAHFVAS